jgi:hypothetical protein
MCQLDLQDVAVTGSRARQVSALFTPTGPSMPAISPLVLLLFSFMLMVWTLLIAPQRQGEVSRELAVVSFSKTAGV